jgi:hypothetical protein
VCCATAPGAACTGAGRALPVNCACPRGSETRFNRCCPVDAGSECPPGEIGAPCEVSEDCRLPVGAATQLTGRADLSPICIRASDFGMGPFRAPRGYCSVRNCMNDAECGPNSACVQLPFIPAFCARACPFPAGATSASCAQTGDQLSCFPLTFLGRRADICFPDCTRDPSVCQGTHRCFPDLRYCASPCSVAGDNTRCALEGYRNCNVAAGHCQY